MISPFLHRFKLEMIQQKAGAFCKSASTAN